MGPLDYSTSLLPTREAYSNQPHTTQWFQLLIDYIALLQSPWSDQPKHDFIQVYEGLFCIV